MGEKINVPKTLGEIPLTPTPTQAGLIRGPTYANGVRIAADQYGFTVYFFSIPPEVLALPGVREQMPPGTPKGLNGGVEVELEPVAKVFIPKELMPVMLGAIAKSYSDWSDIVGKTGRTA